jgi:hypothetical protein
MSNLKGLPKEAQDALNNIEFDPETGVANIEKVQDALDMMGSKAEESSAKIDDLTKKLPAESFARLAAETAKAGRDAEKATAARKKAAKEAKEAEGTPEEADASERFNAALKKESELAKKREALKEKITKRVLDSLNQDELTEKQTKAVADIMRDIASGTGVTAEQMLKRKDRTQEQIAILNAIRDAEGRLLEDTKDYAGVLKQLDTESEKLRVAEQVRGRLEAFLSSTNNVVNTQKKQLENQEELAKLIEEYGKTAENFTKLSGVGIPILQRQADIEKSKLATAKILGNVAEQTNRARDAELAVAEKSVTNAVKTEAKIRERISVLRKALGVKGIDAATETKITNQISDLEKQIVEVAKQRGEAIEAIANLGEGIGQALDAFEDSLAGRRLKELVDLSGIEAELASFSGNWQNAIEGSTETAIAAANKLAEERARILNESIKKERQQLEARARLLEATGQGGAAARLREEGQLLLDAKERGRQAQLELDRKKAVVDAASREASLKREAIDIEQELIDAEMDFLSEVGGSFDAILGLQAKSLQLEQEKLRVAEEELAVAKAQGVGGIELRKKEAAVVKAQIAVQKKALGAQKDVFEKLLGKVFGEIRGQAGAARRRDSSAQIMGRGRTRVMGRSGLFLKGEAKPIAERALDRQLEAQFGGGKLGALDKAPKRLSIEEQIAKAGKATATETSRLVDIGETQTDLLRQIARGGMDGRREVASSDRKIEKKQQEMTDEQRGAREEAERRAQIMNPLAAGPGGLPDIMGKEMSKVGDVLQPIEGESEKDRLYRQAMLDSPGVSDIEKAEIRAGRVVARDVTKTTPAEVAASKAPDRNIAAVPPETTQANMNTSASLQDVRGGNDVARSDVASMRGAIASAPETTGIRLTGEIKITTEDGFKAKFVSLVAQSISTAEVREQLKKNGIPRVGSAG